MTEPQSNSLTSAPRSRRRLFWWCVVLGVPISAVLGCIVLIHEARQYAQQAACYNKLHQINFELNSYRSQDGCFPPARTADKNGRPLQSWRAHLMVYLRDYNFDEHYDMSEPWDSPKNSAYGGDRADSWACSSASRDGARLTNYVAVVGPETVWPGEHPVRNEEIVNWDAICVVEYPKSDILWNEPRDLTVEEFLAMLESRRAQHDFGPHPNGLLYVTARGEIGAIDRNTDMATVRQLLRARRAQGPRARHDESKAGQHLSAPAGR